MHEWIIKKATCIQTPSHCDRMSFVLFFFSLGYFYPHCDCKSQNILRLPRAETTAAPRLALASSEFVHIKYGWAITGGAGTWRLLSKPHHRPPCWQTFTSHLLFAVSNRCKRLPDASFRKYEICYKRCNLIFISISISRLKYFKKNMKAFHMPGNQFWG